MKLYNLIHNTVFNIDKIVNSEPSNKLKVSSLGHTQIRLDSYVSKLLPK